MALTGGNSDAWRGRRRLASQASCASNPPAIPASPTTGPPPATWCGWPVGTRSCSAPASRSASSGWSAQALMPAAIGRAIDAGVAAPRHRRAGRLGGRAARPRRAPGGRRHHAAPVRGLQLAGRRLPDRPGDRPAGGRLGATLPTPGRRRRGGQHRHRRHRATSAARIDITARGAGAVVAFVVVAVILLHRVGAARPGRAARRTGADGRRRAADPAAAPAAAGVPRAAGRLTTRAADIVGGLRVLRGIGGEPIFSARYRTRVAAGARRPACGWPGSSRCWRRRRCCCPALFVALVTWLGARFAVRRRDQRRASWSPSTATRRS